MNKTFILGLGAQKAGTSWLFEQISNSKYFQKGFCKEMRILSHLNNEEMKEKRIKNLLKKDRKKYKNKMLASFLKNPRKYYDYFQELASKDSVTHVGEITPLYCSLKYEELKYISDTLDKRNFQKKIIFIVRDPFKRLLSQFGMIMKRKDLSKLKISKYDLNQEIIKNPYMLADKYSEKEIIEEMRKLYKSNEAQIRTKYDLIIPRLLKVFNEKDLFIDFFEDMFNDDFSKRFKEFIDLDDLKMEFNKPMNVTPKFRPLPDDFRSEIINYYSKTYRYMKSLFTDKTSSLWRDSLTYLK